MSDPPLLREEIPELASSLESLLRKEGLDDLAESVDRFRIHASTYSAWSGGIYGVSRAQAEGYMYNPRRVRHWLGRVPRRPWGLVVDVIDGQIVHISIDHVGILRPVLKRLAKRT